MPIGQFKNFAECVRKNQDKRDPQAYCAEIENRIKKAREKKRKRRD